jgi:addiction module HigA family antidote
MPALARPIATPAGIRQRTPVHPGRFLQRHFLVPLALNQTAAAKRLGVSRRRLHELVHGKRAMSPDTAIRCAQTFGLPAADWLAMQSAWDAWLTWQQLRQSTPMRARVSAGEAGTAR